jgi:hypothetical protein
MAPALHGFENAAGDAIAALDRLIDVGDAAQHDRLRPIARLGEFGFQELNRVRLDEQLGLEIEPWRKTDIGVVWARVAIDAAVLAAAIGIDRLVEGDVRAVVDGDDRLRQLWRDDRLKRTHFLCGPAVIEGFSGKALVAAARIAARAPAIQRVFGHCYRIIVL